MEVREQAVSLVATAHNHGDLAVKLSSLRQLKDLLSSSSSHPSIFPHVFPFLADLHSSPQPLVRKFLLEVIEEIGLRFLEHSSLLTPVLSLLAKDVDPGVARQSIASGMKFFSAVVEELALQFHRQGKVERWAEEMWMQMIEFKNVVLSLVFEPISVGTRLLAVKFLETFVLLFTPDAADSDKPTSGVMAMAGNEHRFNICWVASGHPVLNPAKLMSEASSSLTSLVDMLQSSSSIPGPVTIAVVNSLAVIARRRPGHYGKLLSTLVDFHSSTETTRGGHVASLQYSIRSALLGFLRCTHPVISESRDKLVRLLRSMNAGDAADQVLRQVDKLMRNNDRPSREARGVKEEPSSNQVQFSGDPIKRKLISPDSEEPTNGLEIPPKRMRYTYNGRSPDVILSNEPADDNANNGISSKPSILNNLNPVEQMITAIGAFLAEGERAAESLDLLITQIQPDLLADIVIRNMKHLPKTLPLAKPGSLALNAHSTSAASFAEAAAPDNTAMSVNSSLSTSRGSIPEANTVSTSLPDFSSSTNHPADSRRDPRRDPRRLDPRRAAVPVETPLLPAVEEITQLQSGLEGAASVNKLPCVPAGLSTEQIPLQDADVDENGMRPSLVAVTEEEMAKEEATGGAREVISSTEVHVLGDRARSPDHVVDESSQMSSDVAVTDASDASFFQEFDDYSPPVSIASASEETSVDLPQVPHYIDLSIELRQTMRKQALERIVRSYKQLKNKDFSQTRMALLARLVSWMEADDVVTEMLQEDIVLDYRDQQGHELVMHVLYHLHGLMATESDDQSPGAAIMYEKFLLGVAKSLLDTLPASDKSFSRLLGEAPTLTDSVMKLLENICCPDKLNAKAKDISDDRITQGLGAVWSLILGRPLNRQACLTIALRCAVHSEDDTRAKAIRLVANKLYPLNYLSETIEEYAINMLLSAVDSDASESGSIGHKSEEMEGDEDASISVPQLSESGTSTEKLVKGVHRVSAFEAQRLISLYFALCTKKPGLLQLVFDVYARSGKCVKQAIHRHIPILLRALGSSYAHLLRIISDPPTGSENLLMLVLQILAEQTTPSPDLIATVKHLYETKLKDASILIPMLSSLSKNEVLPIFPRLVDLPLDKFQQALARILQGSAHTGPALTPAEVLVAIHDIVPDKEGIKKVTDACSACFEQRTVFTQHVLEKALGQMVVRKPLPVLFMRTVIQAVDAFPSLVDFVMEVLSKLVSRQIWINDKKQWIGFLKCVSQTQPHSFHVLLQLPAPQLELSLKKYANLRGPLAAYSSQPNIKSSLPRESLVVLGLVHESQITQPHTMSSLQTSDTSSVRGATST